MSTIIVPPWFPPEIKKDAEEYLTNRTDDKHFGIIKNFIIDDRAIKVWDKFNNFESGKGKFLLPLFFRMLLLIPTEADNIQNSEEKKVAVEKLTSILKSIRQIKKDLNLNSLDRIFSKEEKLDDKIIELETLFNNTLNQIQDTEWSEILFGEKYKNAANFARKGADDAKEVYAFRVLSIAFNDFFGKPHHQLAGITAGLMYRPNEIALDDEAIGNRVRKHVEETNLLD